MSPICGIFTELAHIFINVLNTIELLTELAHWADSHDWFKSYGEVKSQISKWLILPRDGVTLSESASNGPTLSSCYHKMLCFSYLFSL